MLTGSRSLVAPLGWLTMFAALGCGTHEPDVAPSGGTGGTTGALGGGGTGTAGVAGMPALGGAGAVAVAGGPSALGGASGSPSALAGAGGQHSGGRPASGGTAGARDAGGASSGTAGARDAGGASAGMPNAGGKPSGGSTGVSGMGSSSGAAGSGGSHASSNVTVWLAGDSTVANGNTPCPKGWGASFDQLFDDRVTVTNSAAGGRSVRTWLYNVQTTMDGAGECELELDASGAPVLQARWQSMSSGMKAGDYLFIQFGINDASATCDRHVGIEAFKASYRMMADVAKQRGAQPIFVTPVSAIACNGSTPKGSRGGYVTATLEAGAAANVPVIDLHAASIALYGELGFCPVPGGDVSASTTGPVGDFFCDDHTHFSSAGAARIAALVAEALKMQKLGLAAYLK